jgi:tetratricopeptide (TPR) repeat protein
MSVDDIDRRLDQRFALLTGGARTLPIRQQTLRAAIDWSFDLLSETEKASFCATSVFAGGFTLEAAERICADDTIPAHDVLDLLTSLADKSLLVVEERDHGTRYRLLETVREFAAQRSSGLFGDARWSGPHLAYFLALAEEAEPQLKGIDQQAWLERLEIEHDNVRAALVRSTAASGDGERGLLLASAFARFWLVRGFLAEGRRWFSRLLDAAPADPATRAKALNWAGIFAWKQGDYPAAHSFYERSLTLRGELGDRKGVGAVLNNQGLLAYEQGDYRSARSLHEESLAIDRELGDRWGVAVSLIHLASLAMMQGDHASARALNDESLTIFREFGDRGHVANALRSLGNLRSQLGEHAAGRALYEESLAICRELGDRSGIAGALHGLGVCARHTADDSARALLEDSLAIYRELGDREGTAKSLTNLGHVAAARGDHATALTLQQQSLAIYRQLNDRVGIACSIEGLAGASAALGAPARAAALWGAAERLREEIAAPMPPSERLHYDRAVRDARAAAAEADAFDRAWREGRDMTPEQAIAHPLLDDRHQPVLQVEDKPV